MAIPELSALGSFTVVVEVSVHKVVVSVTVTVYTPAVNPEIDWVVAPPGLHE